MSNELYFISIIAKGLQQEDTGQSLKDAFEQIESLGTKPGYEQGFAQFQRFMDTVHEHVETGVPDEQFRDELAKELIVELATDTFEGGSEEKMKALNIIKSNPKWQEEYDQLVAEIEELSQMLEAVEVVIFRNNEPFKSVTFDDVPGSKTIERITAGFYKISFASGNTIWQGKLTEQDLVWARAYPGRPFDLAADTTGSWPKPVKQLSLFHGDVVIRIYPSIESGSMKITINKTMDTK